MGAVRVLLPRPGPDADLDVDVHAHYAAGWVREGGLRVNFISSADGAATFAGRSAGLQTPGDNRVFAALRDLADVVLAGAGTVREEGYAAVELPPDRRALRRAYGLADALPTAVVSRSLRLDPDSGLFAATGHARTIVLTCAAADPAAQEALRRVADVVVCGERGVDLAHARAALAARGHTRILCEGGPTLFAGLARAGVADELCLSITPLLTGPGAQRIVAGGLWPDGARPLRLTGLLEEDGALFCRYRL
jgi:riboflavin biosynthesis pyrimidine reductase